MFEMWHYWIPCSYYLGWSCVHDVKHIFYIRACTITNQPHMANKSIDLKFVVSEKRREDDFKMGLRNDTWHGCHSSLHSGFKIKPCLLGSAADASCKYRCRDRRYHKGMGGIFEVFGYLCRTFETHGNRWEALRIMSRFSSRAPRKHSHIRKLDINYTQYHLREYPPEKQLFRSLPTFA